MNKTKINSGRKLTNGGDGMRLIDADAYSAEMRKRQDACREWKDSLNEESENYARAEQSFVTFIEAELTLKTTPTIDAIPVEWLVKQMNRADDAGDLDSVDLISWLIQTWNKERQEADC